MSSDDINKNLAEVLAEWYSIKCTKWMEDKSNIDNLKDWISQHYINGEEEKENISFTEPFCTAVLDNYDKNKTIMFVGQETNGYGDINNFKKNVKQSIKESQNWLKEFLTYNLNSKKPKEKGIYSQSGQKIPYKNFAFIKALRTLSSDYNICWNNIDKIQYKTDNIKGIKLYVEDEKTLNGELNNDSTLLLKEIDIVKPDLIVFAIGPSYKDSLEFSTGLKFKDGEKPSLEKPIISGFSIKGVPCLWTYHPRYSGFEINSLKDSIKNNLI